MKKMTEKQEIERLLSQGKLDEAINALTANLEEQPQEAMWHYLRGRAYWRLDQRGRAISDYEHAASLDPDGPGAAALQMAREIMDFFNPDMFNP